MKRIVKPIAIVLCMTTAASMVYAGSLNPPTPPTVGTMKPLDEIEPRTPISVMPYTITQSGSYYITKNLTATGSAITINADNVTIDLGGYTLSGPGNSGLGFQAYAGSENVEIRNGTVKNFSSGITTGSDCHNWRIIDVRVLNNYYVGISVTGSNILIDRCSANNNGGLSDVDRGILVSGSARITNCIANNNKKYGIDVNGNIEIVNCISNFNGTTGISTSDNTSVIQSSASSNGSVGIEAADYCRISDCIANLNTGAGISAGINSTVSNCTANNNFSKGINVGDYSSVTGCLACNNFSNGIWAGDHSTVTQNTCNSNQDAGIFCWGGSITKNTACSNNQKNSSSLGGILIWSSSQVEENTCKDNLQNGLVINSSGTTVERNFICNSARGIRFSVIGSFYKDNRATSCTTPWFNSAGSTDGGGNISF